MGWREAIVGKRRPRADFEVASEIASMLEHALLTQGHQVLKSPGACIAINALGSRGFSLWSCAPEACNTWVTIAPWPETRTIIEMFDTATADAVPPEVSGQYLGALLPAAVDRLAAQVWHRFKMIQQSGGRVPPPLPPADPQN